MPSNSKISEEYLEVQEKTSTTIPKAMNIEQIIEPFPGGEQVVIEISTSTTEMIPHTIQENDTLTEIVPEMLPETVPDIRLFRKTPTRCSQILQHIRL